MDSGFDMATATSVVQSGLAQLPGAALNHLGEVATIGMSNPVASALLPVIVAGLVQDKTIESGQQLDRKLSEFAEQLDDDDHRQVTAAKLISGLKKPLPDGDRLEEAVIQTNNGDPQALIDLLETYRTDPERRAEYEQSVEALFSGDLSTDGTDDDFIEHLQGVFDAETQDEALATFLDVRELLLSQEVHETLSKTADIETDLTELRAEMERTSRTLETKVEEVLEANLNDEGFIRLNPYYFHHQEPTASPTSWRTGFGLTAVYEGQALERTRMTDTGRPLVRDEIEEQLLGGDNLTVVGRPGTGKSTICKNVACQWYDAGHGAVFYRESTAGKRFTKQGALKNRIREADGHVLVVVEDATRENANEVFETILHFQADDSVSFLLDSRLEEWEDAAQHFDDPRVLNVKEEIDQYPVPQFDEEECARALTLFEQQTGHEVAEKASELLKQIETDIGAGEMYLLGYRLSGYGMNPQAGSDNREVTGLRNEVRQAYDQISSIDDKLAHEVGMLVNVLNAAEIAIHPELIHALADNEAEHGRVDSLLNRLTGYMVFEQNDRYSSNHPFWSAQYLEHALHREERGSMHLFERSLNEVFELFDDAEARTRIRQWCRGDAPYIDEIADDPEFTAGSFLRDVFDLGQRHPSLSPYFGTTEHSRLQFPEVCTQEQLLNCRIWRGRMCLEAGNRDMAETEFEQLIERAKDIASLPDELREQFMGQGYLNLGEVSVRRGDLTQARSHLTRARKLFESAGNERWRSHVLMELGAVSRRSGNFDDADAFYTESVEICREVGYQYGIAKALNNQAMVEKDRGNFEEARYQVERAIELKQDSGHKRSSVALSVNTLGEIHFQQGNLNEAKNQLERSLRIKRDVGYRPGCAWSLYYLGLVLRDLGEYEEAIDHLSESLTIRRELDDKLGEGRCLNGLGSVYCQLGGFDRAAAYHDWALARLKEVGDSVGQARYQYYMGDIALEQRFLNEAYDYYDGARVAFEKIGSTHELAKAKHGLGQTAWELERHESAREFLCESLDTYESFSAYKDAVRVVDDLIALCEETNNHTKARDWRARKRSLENQH